MRNLEVLSVLSRRINLTIAVRGYLEMCFENVKEMSEKFASISPPLPSPFLLHVKHPTTQLREKSLKQKALVTSFTFPLISPFPDALDAL